MHDGIACFIEVGILLLNAYRLSGTTKLQHAYVNEIFP